MRAILSLVMIIFFFISNALGVENASKALNGAIKTNATAPLTNGFDYPSVVLFLIVLILAAFVFIPLYINLIKAHEHLARTDAYLETYLESRGGNQDEDKTLQIIKEYLNADPGGAPGTARGTMALAIILIVGICLFFLLVYPSTTNNANNGIVKDVILTLTGALTSIVGFYFGGNGSAEKKTLVPDKSGPSSSETVTSQPGRKSEMYEVKKEFTDKDKKYNVGEKVDSAKIPTEVLNGWIEEGRVVLFAGDKIKDSDVEMVPAMDKVIPKEILSETKDKLQPGWYIIKISFNHNYDRYIAGNIMNLKDVSAKLLETWKEKKWIDDYLGPVVPVAGSDAKKPQ